MNTEMLKSRLQAKRDADELMKGKKMPIGTVSHGRKKVAEGRWVEVSEKKAKPIAKKAISEKEQLAGKKEAIANFRGEMYHIRAGQTANFPFASKHNMRDLKILFDSTEVGSTTKIKDKTYKIVSKDKRGINITPVSDR